MEGAYAFGRFRAEEAVDEVVGFEVELALERVMPGRVEQALDATVCGPRSARERMREGEGFVERGAVRGDAVNDAERVQAPAVDGRAGEQQFGGELTRQQAPGERRSAAVRAEADFT